VYCVRGFTRRGIPHTSNRASGNPRFQAAPGRSDRTAERYRAEISELLGFREATVADAEGLTEWLRDHAVADTRDICQLTALLKDCCRALRIQPPAPDRVERIVRGALSVYDAT
jgi:hypothetical protein